MTGHLRLHGYRLLISYCVQACDTISVTPQATPWRRWDFALVVQRTGLREVASRVGVHTAQRRVFIPPAPSPLSLRLREHSPTWPPPPPLGPWGSSRVSWGPSPGPSVRAGRPSRVRGPGGHHSLGSCSPQPEGLEEALPRGHAQKFVGRRGVLWIASSCCRRPHARPGLGAGHPDITRICPPGP